MMRPPVGLGSLTTTATSSSAAPPGGSFGSGLGTVPRLAVPTNSPETTAWAALTSWPGHTSATASASGAATRSPCSRLLIMVVSLSDLSGIYAPTQTYERVACGVKLSWPGEQPGWRKRAGGVLAPGAAPNS